MALTGICRLPQPSLRDESRFQSKMNHEMQYGPTGRGKSIFGDSRTGCRRMAHRLLSNFTHTPSSQVGRATFLAPLLRLPVALDMRTILLITGLRGTRPVLPVKAQTPRISTTPLMLVLVVKRCKGSSKPSRSLTGRDSQGRGKVCIDVACVERSKTREAQQHSGGSSGCDIGGQSARQKGYHVSSQDCSRDLTPSCSTSRPC